MTIVQCFPLKCEAYKTILVFLLCYSGFNTRSARKMDSKNEGERRAESQQSRENRYSVIY